MFRFGSMDLDKKNNIPDTIRSALDGELIGITDESKGGIIAYAIGEEHAVLLVQALRQSSHDHEDAFTDDPLPDPRLMH